MENIEERPTAMEELLKKIQKLEESHCRLTHKISNLLINKSHTFKMTESQYMNILESTGRTVHMFDVNNRIVYWNQMAEKLYGYTAAEALGKTAPDIVIAPEYSEFATLTIQRVLKGDTWSGHFPVRTKSWETFAVMTTLAPCRDANETIIGVTCVCADARQFRESGQLDQTALVAKIANLATKVKLTMKKTIGDINIHHDSDFSHSSSTLEHFTGSPTTCSNEGSEEKRPPRLQKLFSLKTRISWPWLYKDQDQESGPQTSSSASLKVESEDNDNTKEAPDSSSSSSYSSWSINSNSTDETGVHIDNMDVEISWDDLTMGVQIGQGSYGSGTVYHALLYGSDVAVKIFTKEEYPNDLIPSFRKEVCLMKRLRHPNILLFMGAVVSPQYLCIVTEFLPRGNLFRLLQRSTTKLDWRRRVHMAMGIARGMIYLHNCQPPIVHCNLKSSNLLVDKNWTLKVGNFGLSHIKHETYLKTNAGTGTPHWMAPEVLRNEQVDEKSDVYSYGVVLWEITTGKIPWENLDALQVIGAVGFMNQRLEIPDVVDPQWASLIESCWSSDPRSRPTFREILIQLKDLKMKFSRAPLEIKGAKIDGENA